MPETGARVRGTRLRYILQVLKRADSANVIEAVVLEER
jgi:hypothetical protein